MPAHSPIASSSLDEITDKIYDWRVAASEDTFRTDVSNGLRPRKGHFYVDLFVNSLPQGTYFPYLSSEKKVESEHGATRRSELSYFYDSFGNQTLIHNHGDPENYFDDRLIWVKYENISDDITPIIREIQRATYEKADQKAWSLSSLSQRKYDSVGLVVENRSFRFWKGDRGSYVVKSTNLDYNEYGQLRNEVGPDGSRYTYTYSPEHRLPVGTINQMSHVSKQGYDVTTGQVTSHIESDGVTYGTTYDDHGRVSVKHDDDGAKRGALDREDNVLEVYQYLAPDLSRRHPAERRIISPNYGSSDENLFISDYMDGFGNVKERRESWEDGRAKAIRRTLFKYNSIGLTGYKSEKHLLDASERSVAHTTIKYDPLGRRLETAYVVPEAQDVSGRKVKLHYLDPGVIETLIQQTPSKWMRIKQYKDVFDQLVRIERFLDGELHSVTSFEYDGLGNLTKKIDTDVRTLRDSTTQFVYNSDGQLVYSDDADQGTYFIEYDQSGRVKSEWNAEGNVIRYSHDILGRVIRKQFDGVNKQFIERIVYDEGKNAIGKVSRILRPNFKLQVSFDRRGRVRKREFNIGGRTATFEISYDHLGRTISLQYPFGVVNYQYDQNSGAIEKIDFDGQSLISNIEYRADEKVSRATFGDDIYLINRYTGDSRLKKRMLVHGDRKIISIDIDKYDLVGNVLEVSRLSPGYPLGIRHSHSYDTLNRLYETKISSQEKVDSKMFRFDGLGNMVWRSDAGTLEYDEDNAVHIPTKVGPKLIENDRAGRITRVDQRVFVWNPESLVTDIQLSGKKFLDLEYDHRGQRTTKIEEDGDQTIYFDTDVELRNESQWLYHVQASGRRVASVFLGEEKNRIVFPFRDHTSNVLARITYDGRVIGEAVYWPYGIIHSQHVDKRDDTDPGRRFADYEFLDDLEIYLTPTRIFDPTVSLFLSPDPANQFRSPYGLSGWNPVNYVDLSGERAVDDEDWSPIQERPRASDVRADRDLQTSERPDREGSGEGAEKVEIVNETVSVEVDVDREKILDNLELPGRDLPELDTSITFELLKQEAGKRLGEILGGEMVGRGEIAENDGAIEAAAKEFGVDPDLIRTVIVKEMTHADPIEQNVKLENKFNWGNTRGIAQTTINSNRDYHLPLSSGDAMEDAKSIRAAAYTLSKEITHLKRGGFATSARAIGSRYNLHNAKGVTRYGREFGRIYDRIKSDRLRYRP